MTDMDYEDWPGGWPAKAQHAMKLAAMRTQRSGRDWERSAAWRARELRKAAERLLIDAQELEQRPREPEDVSLLLAEKTFGDGELGTVYRYAAVRIDGKGWFLTGSRSPCEALSWEALVEFLYGDAHWVQLYVPTGMVSYPAVAELPE